MTDLPIAIICCDGKSSKCCVDPASVATTHSSPSVPCHRSLSLITPLLHVAGRCACCDVSVHNLLCSLGQQYVTRRAPSLRRSFMIATCSSTLANSICESAPQRSQWPRPDLLICASSLHANPHCYEPLVWHARHEPSNEIVSSRRKCTLLSTRTFWSRARSRPDTDGER